ncbi:hypothetical protein PybrP1_007809 [[Pythium] brassicae (nom. inval.)]|nr:hypothetical protein PybrP1_007809 [[Pythium] brassicae (nom. inval.)]
MPLALQPPAASLKKRVLRLCLAALGVAYIRRTWTSLLQQRAMLRLQSAGASVSTAALAAATSGRPPRRSANVLWRALRYTILSQIIAASEFLLPLAKPLLAARIGRLLVWKGPRVQPNAVYGPHERNTVDVYGIDSESTSAAIASNDEQRKSIDSELSARKPVLVFVHGGAWSFGHKWQYGLVGEFLSTTLGVLVAVVNYRTYPTGHVQDMVEDVELAIDWVRKNCHAFGGDKEQIFLSGHSSGAHIGALTLIQSAMRVASPGLKQEASASKTTGRRDEVVNVVKGFIGLAGPYDIVDHYVFESERAVGPFRGVHEISPMKPATLGVENFEAHSPTRLAAQSKLSKLPTFHVLHGVDDMTHAGQDAKFIGVKCCTHEDILFAVMGDDVACRARVVEHIERIMRSAVPRTQEVKARTTGSRELVRPMAKL